MSSTDAKVEQMFQILLDPQEKGTEKKQKVPVSPALIAAGPGTWSRGDPVL